MVVCLRDGRQVNVCRRALREQWSPPRNAIPMPAVLSISQRPSSPLVDIDYLVTDVNDTNVTTAMLIFTNAVQSTTNCVRQPTWAEGSETNLGAGITANEPHRVTWDASVDCGGSLSTFKVAILAKDSRQGLLDVHYLRLPADRDMPELQISRSPLIPADFMQVWWWLLATNDPAIRLTSGKIYGQGGAYDGQMLCDGSTTSTNGRAYLFEKMNVRQATTNELQWARQGASVTSTNQWTPTRTVGGRPIAVNEYGFDTGNWGTNAWWIVPLN